MTNENYTHLLAVVDRSGSMKISGVYIEMQNALNTYFEEQAELDGECLVDYYQFDEHFEKVFGDTPVADAKALIEPRGMTALVDAIGKASVELGYKLEALSEDDRPGKVIVVVVTDGGENSSREWTAESLKEYVEKQRNDFNWEYVFLGANMDAVATGTGYGFATGSSLTFDTSNVYAATASLSGYTTAVRSGGAGSAEFTDEDRENNS